MIRMMIGVAIILPFPSKILAFFSGFICNTSSIIQLLYIENLYIVKSFLHKADHKAEKENDGRGHVTFADNRAESVDSLDLRGWMW